MSNTAKQEQVTLHLIGQHVMWGIEQQFFMDSDQITVAINGNVENVAPPVMAPKRERKVIAEPASTENVVKLFGAK